MQYQSSSQDDILAEHCEKVTGMVHVTKVHLPFPLRYKKLRFNKMIISSTVKDDMKLMNLDLLWHDWTKEADCTMAMKEKKSPRNKNKTISTGDHFREDGWKSFLFEGQEQFRDQYLSLIRSQRACQMKAKEEERKKMDLKEKKPIWRKKWD